MPMFMSHEHTLGPTELHAPVASYCHGPVLNELMCLCLETVPVMLVWTEPEHIGMVLQGAVERGNDMVRSGSFLSEKSSLMRKNSTSSGAEMTAVEDHQVQHTWLQCCFLRSAI